MEDSEPCRGGGHIEWVFRRIVLEDRSVKRTRIGQKSTIKLTGAWGELQESEKSQSETEGASNASSFFERETLES
jgi:hypothetical protein